MDLDSWAGSIDLSTPAGQLIQKLIASLPPYRSFDITVFRSAPIQIAVDARLNSADVDLFSEQDELRQLVDEAGFGQDRAQFYIQVSSELNFRTSPRWRERAQVIRVANCTLRFPHPIDILIAKLNPWMKKISKPFVLSSAKPATRPKRK